MEEVSKKKWYEGPDDKYGGVRGHWCREPYNNIFIGSSPRDGADKEWADQFDAIVNVSCTEEALFEPSRPDQRTYWYPVNEGGEWSYAFFLMMFKILDHHYKAGHKIYVHCHAGAYRSPSIVRWWIYTKTSNFEKSYELARDRDLKPENEVPEDMRSRRYALYQNYLLGNLPPNFQEFITRYANHREYPNYVSYLYEPHRISNRPELHRKEHKTVMDFINRYKWRIQRPFKNLYERYLIFRQKNIRIQVSRGMSVITKDWKKASKEF